MNTQNKHKQDITIGQIEHETRERLGRIDREFAEGFEIANQLSKTVTIFGSARFTENSLHYQTARQLSARLAAAGFTTVTGGGGGIMEAGNRGAFEQGGETVGYNISLPHEQVLNPYTTRSMPFHYFFARKVILAYEAKAYVYFPGGFGTLDELFEIVTLVQTGKVAKAPIILMGSEFWTPLDNFIKDALRDSEKTITPGDELIYTITDSIDEAVATIEQHTASVSEVALGAEASA